MARYHTVYKTVNLINDKFYIGKHSTDDLEDGYLGSGLLIQHAIELYGRENFDKEILHLTETAEQASFLEKELVTQDLLNNPQCYNLALGGVGGNLGEFVNRKIGEKMSALLKNISKTEAHKQALRNVWKAKQYSVPKEVREKIKNTIKLTWAGMSNEERKLKCGHPGELNGFYGKKHTQKSMDNMIANLPDRSGKNNPRAKKVTLNEVTYDTRNDCMKALGLSKRQLYKLLGEKQ